MVLCSSMCMDEMSSWQVSQKTPCVGDGGEVVGRGGWAEEEVG